MYSFFKYAEEPPGWVIKLLNEKPDSERDK